MQPLSERDSMTIREMCEEYLRAAGRLDSRAIASLYAADGDMIAVDGQLVAGPTAIENYYREQLSGAYKALSITDVQLSSARAAGSDTAVLNAAWQVHGLGSMALRVQTTFVVRRDAEGWRYVAVRFAAPVLAAQLA